MEVYSFTIDKFRLTSMSTKVFIFSVCCSSVSHLNIKSSAYSLGWKTAYSDYFSYSFWCSIARFDFRNFYWQMGIIFMVNVVEGLFMILEAIFKCCVTYAKVTFSFLSNVVTVHVGLINYTFCLKTTCQGTSIFIAVVAVMNLRFIKFVVWNFIIMQTIVGIHIRQTAVANFHIGLFKESMQFVMRNIEWWIEKY